jgi:hypothetical protein
MEYQNRIKCLKRKLYCQSFYEGSGRISFTFDLKKEDKRRRPKKNYLAFQTAEEYTFSDWRWQ